jgi:DinB superfamily
LARPAALPHLLALYDQAFDHAAWHGTPLWGSLRGVRLAQALWRPARDRHNIWEIVLHAAYWKYIVRRRLLRDPGLAFPRPGSNWFPSPRRPDERAWRADLALLKDEHRRLRAVIARFPATHLAARAWRSTWTHAATIYGIASHDLYHAGQIQLLKRLQH